MKSFSENNFLTDLIEAALRKDVRRYLETANIDIAALTESYAVEMLEEIHNIMYRNNTSADDKYEAILKVIMYFPVPPHIN